MEKVKRRLFFWTLVLIFFIAAPAIILNARGYRFDFHRGVFVYSGAITLKTNPLSINLALNGQPASGKMSRINNSQNLTGLLPGDYKIDVSAPGFQNWSKETQVHSGLASEFWNVLLVRNNYQRTAYNDTAGIDRFFISPKNDYIAYTTNTGNNLSVKILNIRSKTTENSYDFSGWQLISPDQKENIEWSPNNDYLSVPVEKTEIAASTAPVQNKKNIAAGTESQNITLYNYFIINFSGKTSFSLNDFLGKNDINHIRWDPKDKRYLFFMEGNSLYRANITDKNDLTLISDSVSAYDLNKSNLYYAQLPNNLIFKSSLDGKSSLDQITNSFPGDNGEYISRMIVYDDNRLALITQNKSLIIYNEGDHDTYFRNIGSDVEGANFSDDGKKLLYWTTHEISVYFTRDWTVQPIRAENDNTNITRYSDPIDNVQWLKDYEHIIFNTGRWIKVIELDPRDHRICMDVTNTAIDSPFIRYNNYLEYMFFADKNGDNTTLDSIVFPEPVPLLGIGG